MNNLILNTDSYKTSHYVQYPEGTTFVNSYIEPRKGDKVLFFGLQMFIKKYLMQPITVQMVNQAETLLKAHGVPFNREGWMDIVRDYKGFLPLSIMAVKEGTVLSCKNMLVQVRNTDPRFFWLPQYIETALLRAVWYPTTVATNSWKAKQIIKESLNRTSDSLDSLPFKLHDFGSRGASSEETAAIGGLAHLVNFSGTDTISSLVAAMDFYRAESAVGYSIPAAEHSTITSWGVDGEINAYENMIKQFAKPGSLVAVVSDSYDIYKAVSDMWGGTLKQKVIDSGATIVIRPDSGDPSIVLPRILDSLAQSFGFTVNSKGYKVLNPSVRVIQGDGVSLDTLPIMLSAIERAKFSTENVAFGMGGGLLQKVTRDDYGFAMKASAVKKNGEWVDIYKDPITDKGKRSKKGCLTLVKYGKFYETEKVTTENCQSGEEREVYRNGILLQDYTFDEIRKRSED